MGTSAAAFTFSVPTISPPSPDEMQACGPTPMPSPVQPQANPPRALSMHGMPQTAAGTDSGHMAASCASGTDRLSMAESLQRTQHVPAEAGMQHSRNLSHSSQGVLPAEKSMAGAPGHHQGARLFQFYTTLPSRLENNCNSASCYCECVLFPGYR